MTHRDGSPRTTRHAAGAFLRAVGQAINPVRPVFYGLALGAIGVAYLGQPASELRVAGASPPPMAIRPLAARSGASCSLPVGQQVKAVKAFREMMPVFRHPRCLNCHGGVDPLSEKHRGVDQLDADIDRMTDREKFVAQCQDCHDGLKGWTTPGEPVFFVDKSDEELCLQMKRFEPTGAEFVEHIDNDHHGIQFIAAGFAGDRALGEEGLKDYELKREPPPGTQAELTEQARKWVGLLDGTWREPPECGCVMPKIKLQIQHRSEIDPGHVSHRAGQIGFSGDAAFEVTLEPVEQAEGWYRGQTSLVRPLRVYHVNRYCRGTASQKEDWWFMAQVDEKTNVMALRLGFTTSDETGESVCNIGGVVDRAEIYPDMFSDLERIEMPLDSGATKQETLREPTGSAQERLTVKVIAVPKGQ